MSVEVGSGPSRLLLVWSERMGLGVSRDSMT